MSSDGFEPANSGASGQHVTTRPNFLSNWLSAFQGRPCTVQFVQLVSKIHLAFPKCRVCCYVEGTYFTCISCSLNTNVEVLHEKSAAVAAAATASGATLCPPDYSTPLTIQTSPAPSSSSTDTSSEVGSAFNSPTQGL